MVLVRTASKVTHNTAHWQQQFARLPLAWCWHALTPRVPGVTAWVILTSDPAASEIGALLFLLQSSPVPVACLIRHPHVLTAAAARLPRLAMLLCPTLDDRTLTQALHLLPAVHAGCMAFGYGS